MNFKKPLIILILLLFTVAAFANLAAPNCWGLLTLGVDNAEQQYYDDIRYCRENAGFLDAPCHQEANAAFHYNVDVALGAFDNCCCSNSLPCCPN